MYARLFPSGKSPLYVPAEARTEVCGNAYSMRIPERDGDVYGFPLTDTDELKVDGREVPVMAEAQKKPGWKGRTYNGTLELKSAVTGGETLVTGVMRRLVECPMIVAAAQQGEWDLPAFPERFLPPQDGGTGRGGHVEVGLAAGAGEALMIPVVYDRGWSAVRNGVSRACGEGWGVDGGAFGTWTEPGGV